MLADEVNFCPRCGTPVEEAERFGKMRAVCPACGWIHFADPKVAVAALIERGAEVLLVRRAIDPQRGLWTLPAGFVDAGEDPLEAMVRECKEETGLTVRPGALLTVLYGQEHPRGAHIFIVYRAEISGGSPQAQDDVDALGFFDRELLPDLAFQTTRKILMLSQK